MLDDVISFFKLEIGQPASTYGRISIVRDKNKVYMFPHRRRSHHSTRVIGYVPVDSHQFKGSMEMTSL
jgi:hypothetical protein